MKLGAAAVPAFCTHCVKGLRAPQVFCRSKRKPWPCSAFSPLSVTRAGAPAGCAHACGIHVAGARWSLRGWQLHSTPRPRVAARRHVDLRLAGHCRARLRQQNASLNPQKRRRRAPCWLHRSSLRRNPARREKKPAIEPASGLEAGLSSRNSCQRRPLTGNACICSAVSVVATAALTGSERCAAAAMGNASDGQPATSGRFCGKAKASRACGSRDLRFKALLAATEDILRDGCGAGSSECRSEGACAGLAGGAARSFADWRSS